jgi:hypothetical protein
MRKEADLSAVSDLPAEDSSTVTRGVSLAEQESAPNTMTVKQEAEPQDEGDQQMLCDSPVLPCGQAYSGGERHPSTAERAPHETRYGTSVLGGLISMNG